MLASAYSVRVSDEDSAIAHLAFILYDYFTWARERFTDRHRVRRRRFWRQHHWQESSVLFHTSSQGPDPLHPHVERSSSCLSRSSSKQSAGVPSALGAGSAQGSALQLAALSTRLHAPSRPSPIGVGAVANVLSRVLELTDNVGP